MAEIMRITVGGEGCDFSTITEAVWAVPYDEKAEIVIASGVYREKIFCEKKDITFTGAGIDETVLEYGDGAFDMMPDGSKRGTFRSFTAFFAGEKVTVKDMTIRNTAGDGSKAGQALAVYADADRCYFENVRLDGCQDTLFMSPLPLTERQKNGFMGPRVLTPRKLTNQYYKNCIITGDVDFIFGGADAVFDDCIILCNCRQKAVEQALKDSSKSVADNREGNKTENRFINGYITAGCGSKENTGMIFRNCTIKGKDGCDKASVFLGRPWRDEARAVFLNCKMDETIAPERFSGWGSISKEHPDTFYGEFGTTDETGVAISFDNKNAWVKDVDESLAEQINDSAEAIVRTVLNQV